MHRDIKPANILLDASGMGKIADLGLARRLGEDFGMTQSGMIMGTPYYLSPEQAADPKHADHRADIYSFGCMFYEMVCGKVPYAGDTLARIILAHGSITDPRSASASPRDTRTLCRHHCENDGEASRRPIPVRKGCSRCVIANALNFRVQSTTKAVSELFLYCQHAGRTDERVEHRDCPFVMNEQPAEIADRGDRTFDTREPPVVP